MEKVRENARRARCPVRPDCLSLIRWYRSSPGRFSSTGAVRWRRERKDVTSHEVLKVLIAVILGGQELPGIMKAWEPCGILHTAFPNVPCRMIDPVVIVKPVLF